MEIGLVDFYKHLKEARQRYESLTKDQKKAHDSAQRECWVKAEVEMSRLDRETTRVKLGQDT